MFPSRPFAFLPLSLLILTPAVHAATNITKAGLVLEQITDGDVLDASGLGWYHTSSLQKADNATKLRFFPTFPNASASSSLGSVSGSLRYSGVTPPFFSLPHQDTSGISVHDALPVWKQYISPLASQNFKIGTPSTTASDPSAQFKGKQWTADFISQCGGCHLDFVALNWYGTDAAQFATDVQSYFTQFSKPVIVTEWSYQPANSSATVDAATVSTFLNTTQQFLESSDWVSYYSWDSSISVATALLTPTGKLTPLGAQYAASAHDQVTVQSGAGQRSASIGSGIGIGIAVSVALCLWV